MSEPLAHLYDLALRTLDEQERRAEAVRGRLGPVLAAAALGASLLSGPLIGSERPTGIGGFAALTIALGGLVVSLATGGSIVRERRRVRSDTDVRRLLAAFKRNGAVEDPNAFYVAMIAWLGDRATRNTAAFDRLDATFTVMLYGILVMLCGLALAAIVG